MKYKVVIVGAGGWGHLSAEKGDYDTFIGLIKRHLEEVETINSTSGKPERPVAVEVANSFDEALEKVHTYDGSEKVLIFLTRGMLSNARKVKKLHKSIRVILFTGDLPDDEIVVLNKAWYSPELIKTMVLY